MKIIEARNPALFVDMDGTLAEWRPIHVPLQVPSHKIQEYINHVLYQEGYYKNLYPYRNMVEMVKQIIAEGKVDVYILSCVLPHNSKYPASSPRKDKDAWLDEQFGDLIPQDHRIYVKDGEPKKSNIPFKLQDGDVLLDDYTKNLNAWVEHTGEISLKAIKVLNPVNDTHGSWTGKRISIIDKADILKAAVYDSFAVNEKEEDMER